MNSPYIAQIEDHEKEILQKNSPQDLNRCLRCKGKPDKFRLHSYRERIFLVILGSLVQEVKSFLGRFICGICRGSFTYYPSYALPYKRYLRPQIQEKSQEYLQEREKTYEEMVSHEGGAIFYEKEETAQKEGLSQESTTAQSQQMVQQKPDKEKEFSKSTVWRWLGFFGKQEEPLTKALDLVRQKAPQTDFFRRLYLIDPRKYKSQKRKELLITAARFLAAIKELGRFFKEFSVFTDFATKI